MEVRGQADDLKQKTKVIQKKNRKKENHLKIIANEKKN